MILSFRTILNTHIGITTIWPSQEESTKAGARLGRRVSSVCVKWGGVMARQGMRGLYLQRSQRRCAGWDAGKKEPKTHANMLVPWGSADDC